MILPNPKDAIHKAWLYRLLAAISDDPELARALYFKGGTCASMRDFLDRFSIDLDFDFVKKKTDADLVKSRLEKIFSDLGLEIKDQSKNVPQYFLKYPGANRGSRNTIKIDITFPPPQANKYEAVRFKDIDRIIYSQTIETMFANKLVALIERFEKNNSIAGRDLYDIHYFFIRGFRYNEDVIKERRGDKNLLTFFQRLTNFIKNNINDKIISQDLNMLLPYEKFKKIRKTLKIESLMFLGDEIERLKREKSNI